MPEDPPQTPYQAGWAHTIKQLERMGCHSGNRAGNFVSLSWQGVSGRNPAWDRHLL